MTPQYSSDHGAAAARSSNALPANSSPDPPGSATLDEGGKDKMYPRLAKVGKPNTSLAGLATASEGGHVWKAAPKPSANPWSKRGSSQKQARTPNFETNVDGLKQGPLRLVSVLTWKTQGWKATDEEEAVEKTEADAVEDIIDKRRARLGFWNRPTCRLAVIHYSCGHSRSTLTCREWDCADCDVSPYHECDVSETYKKSGDLCR